MSEFHFDLEAGALCLDFANTAEWHASDRPLERLNDIPDLVAWAWQAGILDETFAKGILGWVDRSPDAAAAAFERAIWLRELIYRIFSAFALEQPVDPDDLGDLNQVLGRAMAQARLEVVAGGFTWGWVEDGPGLEIVIWAVARSAAELLTSDQLDRLRRCADDRGCGYLFIDTSRNRSRRWCSMKSCGNRAKAKRHYERQIVDSG
jgi:predicted RNA-binding Zn ribbon-like protein